MTNDENELMQDVINQASNKVELLQKTVIEKAVEIERLKAENEELTKVVSSKVYDLIDNTKEIADAREAWEQQAKIDVLNELKKKIHDTRLNDDTAEIIIEMIEELTKCQK